ncbi:MAG: hypothetical protein AAB089_06705, partial [Nitrospirota bacterium]
MFVVGATAFTAGLAADATGVGAIGGVPLNGVGIALMASGGNMVAADVQSSYPDSWYGQNFAVKALCYNDPHNPTKFEQGLIAIPLIGKTKIGLKAAEMVGVKTIAEKFATKTAGMLGYKYGGEMAAKGAIRGGQWLMKHNMPRTGQLFTKIGINRMDRYLAKNLAARQGLRVTAKRGMWQGAKHWATKGVTNGGLSAATRGVWGGTKFTARQLGRRGAAIVGSGLAWGTISVGINTVYNLKYGRGYNGFGDWASQNKVAFRSGFEFGAIFKASNQGLELLGQGAKWTVRSIASDKITNNFAKPLIQKIVDNRLLNNPITKTSAKFITSQPLKNLVTSPTNWMIVGARTNIKIEHSRGSINSNRDLITAGLKGAAVAGIARYAIGRIAGGGGRGHFGELTKSIGGDAKSFTKSKLRILTESRLVSGAKSLAENQLGKLSLAKTYATSFGKKQLERLGSVKNVLAPKVMGIVAPEFTGKYGVFTGLGKSALSGSLGGVGTVGWNLYTGQPWDQNLIENIIGAALMPALFYRTLKAPSFTKNLFSLANLPKTIKTAISFTAADTYLAYKADEDFYQGKNLKYYNPETLLGSVKNIFLNPGRQILGAVPFTGWGETTRLLSDQEAKTFTGWAATKGLLGVSLAYAAGFSRSWLGVVSLATPIRAIARIDETVKDFAALAKGGPSSLAESASDLNLVDAAYGLGNLAGASTAFKGMGQGLNSKANTTGNFGSKVARTMGDVSVSTSKTIWANTAIGVALPIMQQGNSLGLDQVFKSIKTVAYETDTIVKSAFGMSLAFKGAGELNGLSTKKAIGIGAVLFVPGGAMYGLGRLGDNSVVANIGKGFAAVGAAVLLFRGMKALDLGMDTLKPVQQLKLGGGLLVGGGGTYVLSSEVLAKTGWGRNNPGIVHVFSNLGLLVAGAGGILISKAGTNAATSGLKGLIKDDSSFLRRIGVDILKLGKSAAATTSFAFSTGTMWYGANIGFITPAVEYLSAVFNEKPYKGYAFWSDPTPLNDLRYIFTSGLVINSIYKTAKIASKKYLEEGASKGGWKSLKSELKEYVAGKRDWGEKWLGGKGFGKLRLGEKFSRRIGLAGGVFLDLTVKPLVTMFTVIAPLQPALTGISYVLGKGLFFAKTSGLEKSFWGYTAGAFAWSQNEKTGEWEMSPSVRGLYEDDAVGNLLGAWDGATSLTGSLSDLFGYRENGNFGGWGDSKLGVLTKMFGVGYSAGLFGADKETGKANVKSLSSALERLGNWGGGLKHWSLDDNFVTRTLNTFDNSSLAFSYILAAAQPFATKVLSNIKTANFGRGFRAFQKGAIATFGLKGLGKWADRSSNKVSDIAKGGRFTNLANKLPGANVRNFVAGGAKKKILRLAGKYFTGSIEEINEQNVQLATSIPLSVIGPVFEIFGVSHETAKILQQHGDEIAQELLGDMDGNSKNSTSARNFWASFSNGNPLVRDVSDANGKSQNTDPFNSKSNNPSTDRNVLKNFGNLNEGDTVTVETTDSAGKKFTQRFKVDEGWGEFMNTRSKAVNYHNRLQRGGLNISGLVRRSSGANANKTKSAAARNVLAGLLTAAQVAKSIHPENHNDLISFSDRNSSSPIRIRASEIMNEILERMAFDSDFADKVGAAYKNINPAMPETSYSNLGKNAVNVTAFSGGQASAQATREYLRGADKEFVANYWHGNQEMYIYAVEGLHAGTQDLLKKMKIENIDGDAGRGASGMSGNKIIILVDAAEWRANPVINDPTQKRSVIINPIIRHELGELKPAMRAGERLGPAESETFFERAQRATGVGGKKVFEPLMDLAHSNNPIEIGPNSAHQFPAAVAEKQKALNDTVLQKYMAEAEAIREGRRPEKDS